jgi:hypothetical protein
MPGLDHAVGYDHEVHKRNADRREVLECLLWSRDRQTLAKRGLRRLLAVVRADSPAYLTSTRDGNVTCVAPSGGGAAPHNSAAVWWLMYDPLGTSLRKAFALSSGVIATSRAT